MEGETTAGRIGPSERLLLALIVALPLMKPPVRGEIIAADLLFLLLAVSLAAEILSGRRRVSWMRAFTPIGVYVAALAPSLMAASDLGTSLFKYAPEFYLAGLALITAQIVGNEASFRRAVLAWLAGTAIACVVGLA